MKAKLLFMLVALCVLISSCASNKNSKSDVIGEEKIQIPVPISVGTANVQLEFVSYENDILTAQVVEILGYGATTTPLNMDSNMPFYVHENIIEVVSKMEEGTHFNATVALLGEQMNNNTTPKWRLTKIMD